MIRTAHIDDLIFLPAIERAAGAVFRDIGMDAIADDEPLPISDLLDYQRAGRAWVATDDQDRAVAYILADFVDGNAHIEQVSVHPDYGRRGVGRALIDTVAT
ncbi:GNAT family N-acetyltransferase [Arthrobacter sp. H5]|uniref:GNAT family N-acetyltransferase n=1 Tax=Arthrobacter sp. H5 TaxID=1267973 RepID=UPI0004AFCE97|nr:GNAT family N-acetyltransferase [Arthrobacter sp. H5]